MLRAPVYLNAHVAEYLRQRLAQTIDVLMREGVGQPYLVDGLQILMNEGLGLVDRQKAGIDADGQVAHAERAAVAFSADEVWHLHYSDGLGTDLTRPWPGKDHRLVCASHHAFSFSTGIGGAGARRGKPGRRRDRRTNRRSTASLAPHCFQVNDCILKELEGDHLVLVRVVDHGGVGDMRPEETVLKGEVRLR